MSGTFPAFATPATPAEIGTGWAVYAPSRNDDVRNGLAILAAGDRLELPYTADERTTPPGATADATAAPPGDSTTQRNGHRKRARIDGSVPGAPETGPPAQPAGVTTVTRSEDGLAPFWLQNVSPQREAAEAAAAAKRRPARIKMYTPMAAAVAAIAEVEQQAAEAFESATEWDEEEERAMEEGLHPLAAGEGRNAVASAAVAGVEQQTWAEAPATDGIGCGREETEGIAREESPRSVAAEGRRSQPTPQTERLALTASRQLRRRCQGGRALSPEECHPLLNACFATELTLELNERAKEALESWAPAKGKKSAGDQAAIIAARPVIDICRRVLNEDPAACGWRVAFAFSAQPEVQCTGIAIFRLTTGCGRVCEPGLAVGAGAGVGTGSGNGQAGGLGRGAAGNTVGEGRAGNAAGEGPAGTPSDAGQAGSDASEICVELAAVLVNKKCTSWLIASLLDAYVSRLAAQHGARTILRRANCVAPRLSSSPPQAPGWYNTDVTTDVVRLLDAADHNDDRLYACSEATATAVAGPLGQSAADSRTAAGSVTTPPPVSRTSGSHKFQTGDVFCFYDHVDVAHFPAIVTGLSLQEKDNGNKSDRIAEATKSVRRGKELLMVFFKELNLKGAQFHDQHGLPDTALQYSSTCAAARREIAILSGYPMDQDGAVLTCDHHYYLLGVRVRSDAWQLHLQEMREARAPGQLRAQWHRMDGRNEDKDEWLRNGHNMCAGTLVKRSIAMGKRWAANGTRPSPPTMPPAGSAAAAQEVGLARIAAGGEAQERGLFFVEGMAGTAQFSVSMRNKGFRVLAVDWCTPKPPWTPERLAELGGEVSVLRMDLCNVDLESPDSCFRMSPPVPALQGFRDSPPRVFDAFHLGFDCSTFSRLAAINNERIINNHFMGKSTKAYTANASLAHSISLLFLLKQRNPLMIVTLENPAATMHQHPIIRLAEKPEREGGLGLKRVQLCYCAFGNFPRKDTIFWVPAEWESSFTEGDSQPIYRCSCLRKHTSQVRGSGAGRPGVCAYPQPLCDLLAGLAAKTCMDRRRRFLSPSQAAGGSAPAMGSGHFIRCVECEEGGADGDKLHFCRQCPRASHLACMPPAARASVSQLRTASGEPGTPTYLCPSCEGMPELKYMVSS